MLFFFFSSRRRHTRSLCDWSSDVCSSDLFNSCEVDRLGRFCKCLHGLAGIEVRLDIRKPPRIAHRQQIGRASCREKGEISVVAVSLKKKKKRKEAVRKTRIKKTKQIKMTA